MLYNVKQYKFDPRTGNHYDEYEYDINTLSVEFMINPSPMEKSDWRVLSRDRNDHEIVMTRPIGEFDAEFMVCTLK